MTFLVACGEKAAPPASSATASAPAKASTGSVSIPGDSKSKAFAENLLNTTLSEFQPTDTSGAKLVYKQMRFANDNTWKASAYVQVEDMQMDCSESGTWTMGAADSASTATVSWKLDNTDCAGRDAGSESRALMTLSNGSLKDLKFR